MRNLTFHPDIPGEMLDAVELRAMTCLHGHFRWDPILTPIVVGHAVQNFFANAAEPNITDYAITTVARAQEYREYLREQARLAGKPEHRFYVILQITGETTAEMVREAYEADLCIFKYYPRGATHNSGNGVVGWWTQIMSALRAMAEINRQHPERPIVLQVHAEEASEPDPWKREQAAIKQVEWLANELPTLRLSFEHASTAEAVELCRRCPNIALSVSIVHLTMTRADVVDHESCCISPHHWCAPVAKDLQAQEALIKAVTGQHPELAGRVHLGLDFAPHHLKKKEEQARWPLVYGPQAKLPPMGSYSLDVAIPLLVALFERTGGASTADWIRALTAFASLNGPRWYVLPEPDEHDTIKLRREPWVVPDVYCDHEGQPALRSFMAGKQISWRVVPQT